MHFPTIARTMALAALLLGACSGGGDDGEEALAVARPEGFAASAVAGDFDVVALTWDSPRTAVEMEVQTSVDGGAWVSHPYRVPASSVPLLLYLAGVPEMTTLGFRARTVLGDAASEWSGESTLRRGVRPADELTIESIVGPRSRVNALRWTRRSLVADRVTLERQVRPTSGEPGPWVALAVASGTTAYDDVNPPGDLVHWAYRVTYWAGEQASDPVEQQSQPSGPAAPYDLSATVTGSDLRVTWANGSAAAARIQILRTSAATEPRAWTLPGTVTSLEEPALGPGLYEYSLQSTMEEGSTISPSSISRVAAVIPASSHAAACPARALYLPVATGIARSAAGAFAVANGTSDSSSARALLYALGDATWDPFETPGDAGLAVPGPLVDEIGRVHAVYFERVWEGATQAPVRYAWHDRYGWHVEYVGLAPRHANPFAALASDGSIHVVWQLLDETGFAYATNAGGSFVVEEVRPSAGAKVKLITPLVIDGDAPRILVGELYASPARVWLASGGGGSWSAGTVPDIAAIPEGIGNLVARGGTLAWIYGLSNGTGYDLWLRERSGGTWSAPEKLASTSSLPLPGVGASISPDATRIALVTPGRGPSPSVPARLIVIAGGVATVTDLLPSTRAPQVGFTPTGKLWVLDGLVTSSGVSGTSPYALFEEP